MTKRFVYKCDIIILKLIIPQAAGESSANQEEPDPKSVPPQDQPLFPSTSTTVAPPEKNETAEDRMERINR